MKRFAIPVLAVLIGLAVSHGGQAAGVAPLAAKGLALLVIGLVMAADWQRRARI